MSVPTGDQVAGAGAVQATFAATLVDEWVRSGLTDAVVCPGSRSTPLVLALAARSELRLHVHLDERGAGFFAVGLGLATGRPAILCTTSGTAAAELHPAVVEAHYAGVPLIACTADRPPELHGIGAPQTIDQVHLFGSAPRWFSDPGVAVAGAAASWRPLAARAVAEAVGGPCGPGPVHLNLAFGDRLVDGPYPLPAGRPDGRPYFPGPLDPWPGGDGSGRAAATVAGWPGRRGLVVAGAGAGPPAMVAALAEHLAWPLLADPRSGCRVEHPNVVAAADALLRTPGLRAPLRPEVVLVLGAPWASRALGELLGEAARSEAEVVSVDPYGRRVDPDRIVTEFHRASTRAWLETALGGPGAPGSPAAAGTFASESGWLGRWQAVERAAQRAIDDTLAEDTVRRAGRLSEPALARRLLGSVPAGTRVMVASSMPVRDLEWFSPPMELPPLVLANRGANGIDGVSSTARGVAAAGLGPVVGVLGDLAFLHDVSALVRPVGRSAGASCTLVAVDNGGGGIFSFLPQAGAVEPALFERLFGTAQAPDLVEVAGGFGVETGDVATPIELDASLRASVGHHDLAVIRVRVPGRAENVALHGRIHDAVAAAARAVLG